MITMKNTLLVYSISAFAARLEENVIVSLVQHVVHGLAGVDSLLKQLCLESFSLLAGDTLLVLNLLQAIELLALEFVELGNDVGQSSVDSRNDD